MTLSNKFKNIINQAVKDENIDDIIKHINYDSKDEERREETKINHSYSVIKLLKDYKEDFISEWINKIKPDDKRLKEYKKIRNDVKKQEKEINTDLFKYIIDNQEKSDLNKFIYVLINTGRRTAEINEGEYKKQNDKLLIELKKKKNKELCEAELLDGDIDKTIQYIKDIRDNGFNTNSLSQLIKRRLIS